MEVIVVVGAGLDVHKKKIVACCIDGRSSPPKIHRRTFGTFQDELEQLRSWLVAHECSHVAMESTGVYWMPVYRVLEGTVTIVLGNARHIANVPGRKTDLADAEWIAQLLRFGLIQPNFVPARPIRDLRLATRYRRKLIGTRTAAQLRIDKLLEATNVKLSSVASELFGVSGRLMLAALARGTTDPAKLADLAKGKLRGKRLQLARAFASEFNHDHARLLALELKLVNDLDAQIARADKLIEQKVTPYSKQIDLLDTIPGIDRTLAVDLLAEIGPDMTAWPTADKFIAWTGTCPGNRQSAGVRKRARTRDGNPYVRTILIQAAVCATNVIGSYYAAHHRRLTARRGPARAYVAVARQIAIAAYHMLLNQEPYKAPKIADPNVERQIRANHLIHELSKLGIDVTATHI